MRDVAWIRPVGALPGLAKVELWLNQGFAITWAVEHAPVRVCMPGSKNAGSMLYYLANENRRWWLRTV